MGFIIASCWQVSSSAFLLFCNQINMTVQKTKKHVLHFGTV